MTELVIYGDPDTSRTWWTIWMCQELGLEFENERLSFLDPHLKSTEYRAINPNGSVPAIRDGDFLLWESMAINLYLAKKYGQDIFPDTLESEALAWQWSFWAVSRFDAPLLTLQAANQQFPQGSEIERYYRRHLPPWSAEEIMRCREALEVPSTYWTNTFHHGRTCSGKHSLRLTSTWLRCSVEIGTHGST